MTFDHDDARELRSLSDEFFNQSRLYTEVLEHMDQAREDLDLLIVQNSDKLPESASWQNKVLKLMSAVPESVEKYKEWRKLSTNARMLQTTLKALNEKINVLKKIYHETPKELR